MSMTPEAKTQLSATIRALRDRLLTDLHASVEGAYRMSVRPRDAGLGEVQRTRRQRLEDWVAEQVRVEIQSQLDKKQKASWTPEQVKRTREDIARELEDAALADRFRKDAEKQAAYTLLNRLVLLRLMEAAKIRAPAVVTGGWNSAGYQAFRQLAAALRNDDTEGYGYLLKLVFDDLATDLPGLFGPAGVAELVPVPAATLRHLVEQLDDPGLNTCWTDDMTLGWVYQYWNDPEREAIDAAVKDERHKVQRHEIASKTQMFTDRYMVDWLLQNSLGPLWQAMCKKQGWTPEVERDGILAGLEERRVEWRRKRDAGDVTLAALMPLHSDVERRWAYFLPQDIPDSAVQSAPASVRNIKLLDPAVGSGHFLVVAFELLFALYEEEARQRGEARDERWQPRAIVEHILEDNLHGIDLDPRAVQIAAAALWLKAKARAPEARPVRLNLVASALRLARLPDDDTALVELRREVERETGLPPSLTDTLVHALRGADHLGSLLRIDAAVSNALSAHEAALGKAAPQQTDLFRAASPVQARPPIDEQSARETLLSRLETFLTRHTGSDELGLRLHGEQLATGVRFIRMLKEEDYDIVIANPPYHSAAKLDSDAVQYQQLYPLGKADLFAAMMLRSIDLARPGGRSATATLSNWMSLTSFKEFREHVLAQHHLAVLADLGKGSFSSGSALISASLQIFVKNASRTSDVPTIALRPHADGDLSTDEGRPTRNLAGMVLHSRLFAFRLASLRVVPEWPLVYWWSKELLAKYERSTLFGKAAPAKKGMITSDNGRFIRFPHEVLHSAYSDEEMGMGHHIPWAPIVSGAQGRRWIEPLTEVVRWAANGLEVKVLNQAKYGSYTRQIMNEELYFRRGVSFTSIGGDFGARLHRFKSVIGSGGGSLFPDSPIVAVAWMNSTVARGMLQSLNPTINFTAGDVNRLPCSDVPDAGIIFGELFAAFANHEATREPSVEFRRPGSSTWRSAEIWAQFVVDRSVGTPVPNFDSVAVGASPTDYLSYAVGVALGRFGGDGNGVLASPSGLVDLALPAGLLFLDATLVDEDYRDSLGHAAAQLIRDAWTRYGAAIRVDCRLREYLRTAFFAEAHRGMYENRPIHWPLSSERRTFVAWVNIHRMNGDTLKVLLADHLNPTLARIDGELADLRNARDGADKKASRAAEKRFALVQKAKEELVQFIASVEQCAERGPPPTDAKCPARAVDARYNPDLDDGVVINSAALWPLLEPQWKDPKKWWKELASAQGKKDYDWSHLAMKYWPERVDKKCQEDPSLGVAHGCFWRYHPARAWAWELRLQDEIGPDFRIEEKPYRDDTGDVAHRARYLREHAAEALEAVEKEALRRRRKQKKAQGELRLLEDGLWRAQPALCWDMELRISEKQGAEFRLVSPDEDAARAAFLRANPEKVRERADMLAELKPLSLLPEDDEADAVDDEASHDAGEEESA